MKIQDLIDSTAWVRLVCFAMAFMTRLFDLSAAEMAWLFVPAALTGILSVCLRGHRTWLCCMPLLLTAVYVIPKHTAASLIAMAAVLSSCFLFTWKQAWTATRSGVEKMLYRGLGGYVVFALPMLFRGGSWTASLSFLIVFLSLTVFVLRVLRSDRIADPSYVYLNSAVCVIMTVVLLVFCTPVFRDLLMRAVLLAAQYIALPALWVVLMAFTLAFRVLLWIVSPLLKLLGLPGQGLGLDFEITDLSEMTEEQEIAEELPRIPDLVWFIGLTVILAVLVYLVIRRIRSSAVSYGSAGTVERKYIPDARPQRKTKNVHLNAVRTLYVKYLRHMKKEGMTIDPCDTSEIQAQHADALLQKSWGSQMREIWLPARYGREEDADLSRARELYRKIRRPDKAD